MLKCICNYLHPTLYIVVRPLKHSLEDSFVNQ